MSSREQKRHRGRAKQALLRNRTLFTVVELARRHGERYGNRMQCSYTHSDVVSPRRPLEPNIGQRFKPQPAGPSAVNNDVFVQRCGKKQAREEKRLGGFSQPGWPVAHGTPGVRAGGAGGKQEHCRERACCCGERHGANAGSDGSRVIAGAPWNGSGSGVYMQREYIDDTVCQLSRVDSLASGVSSQSFASACAGRIIVS